MLLDEVKSMSKSEPTWVVLPFVTGDPSGVTPGALLDATPDCGAVRPLQHSRIGDSVWGAAEQAQVSARLLAGRGSWLFVCVCVCVCACACMPAAAN
jgi:hypothetical protein